MSRNRIIGSIVFLLYIVVITYLPLSAKVYGSTGINQIINFQGKVVNSDGTNVADNTYDFTVKLYDGAASASPNLYTETWSAAALWSSTMSSAPTSGAESLTYSTNTNESTIKVGQIIWNTTKGEAVTVTSINTGTNVMGISPTRQAWANGDTVTNKIYVKDGVFKISINSLNQDLSAVDFNSDTIFLGVNFNADGEMKPRVRFTATPYAFNAQKVNGLTVTNTTGTLTIPNSTTIAFGANNTTFSTSGTTTVTLPTTGTLSTLAGNEILTNKSIGSTGLIFSGSTTDITTGTNEDLAIVPNGTGKVGVGTTSPTALFNVEGAVKGKALVILNETGNQALFTASASGVTKLIVDHNGNVGIGTTSPTYKTDILSSDTTGLLQLTGNSITTGTGLNLVASGLTSGNAMAISSVSTALTSGGLLSLDWSPGSATTATGDILGINIGGNGVIGNLFNLKNNGASIFSVSQTQITNGLPTNFTAPGDVAIAYDLTFTNQTASYIKSNAPLYLETGESFESNDLTLRTFNSGNIIADLTGAGGFSIGSAVSPIGKFQVEGAKVGKALAIFNETGNQDIITASASGTTVFSVNRSGNVTFNQASTIQTSTGALTFQAGGASAISTIQIGAGGTGSTTPDYLGLDVKSTTGDPAGGFEGAMYYNTFDNKFRCYQGAAWTDCIGSGGPGGSVTVRESDASPSVSSVSTIEFGPASTSSDEFIVTDQTGGVTRVILGDKVVKSDNSLVLTNKSIGSTGLNYTGATTDITTGSNEDFTISPNGSGKVVLGTTTNGFTFDPATGPTYSGTARPAKTIKLSPEFIGAALTASGSATTNGTMTSDTVRDTTAGWENYYEWSSTQGSFQDYTIAVKVTLPSDFGNWATSNAFQLNYATENTSTAKNKLDVSIYNMTTSADQVVIQSQTNASGTNGVWTTLTFDDSQLDDNIAPDWDGSGQTAIIFIKPYSLVDAVNCTAGVDNGCYVRIGDIVLNYVAKF